MTAPLVLSIFPGIDLLGMAFELEGFCVVRGPDVLWGGDIRRFSPPAGVFDGVIGGPPCKGESNLAHLNGTPGMSMRQEFMRVADASRASWFVMEAVTVHDDLIVGSRHFQQACVTKLSPRWLGEEQSRVRFFHSNLWLTPHIDVALFENPAFKRAVLAGHGPGRGKVTRRMTKYEWAEACRLQGLREDFDLPGFTYHAKYEALGNGVPLPMGRAIARAVRRAMGYAELAA